LSYSPSGSSNWYLVIGLRVATPNFIFWPLARHGRITMQGQILNTKS